MGFYIPITWQRCYPHIIENVSKVRNASLFVDLRFLFFFYINFFLRLSGEKGESDASTRAPVFDLDSNAVYTIWSVNTLNTCASTFVVFIYTSLLVDLNRVCGSREKCWEYILSEWESVELVQCCTAGRLIIATLWSIGRRTRVTYSWIIIWGIMRHLFSIILA